MFQLEIVAMKILHYVVTLQKCDIGTSIVWLIYYINYRTHKKRIHFIHVIVEGA